VAGLERRLGKGERDASGPHEDQDPERHAPDLDVAEAEVWIVKRDMPPPTFADERGTAAEPLAAGSLRDRLRLARIEKEFDGESYAAYRDTVEEASVEIIFPRAGSPGPANAGEKTRPAGKRVSKKLDGE
jgi:hypothetical protein